jgi:CDP-paratose 2-epimerase
LTYFGWQGKQVRDVLFVDDMISLLELQISNLEGCRGQVFNVGGGAGNSISLCEATVSMQEISSRHTVVTQLDQERRGDIVLYWTDNRKARQKLGWQPKTTLHVGFTGIFEWIRENEAELRSRYCR